MKKRAAFLTSATPRRLLNENRDKLDHIVEQRLIYETLEESEVYAAAGIQSTSDDARAGRGRRP